MQSAVHPARRELGVNVDHVATLRQQRGTRYPDPVQAALVAEQAGADSITVHLREDRRHIQDRDVERLAECLVSPLNLEMAATDEMVKIATRLRPEYACLVPERREELTTEGGLDVVKNLESLRTVCDVLKAAGIRVSLFIDPDLRQIDASLALGVPAIELHTGEYAEQRTAADCAPELQRLSHTAEYARQAGLIVNAGHGLHYHNIGPVAAISALQEFNIGHAIIARAVIDGLPKAVSDMRALLFAPSQGIDVSTLALRVRQPDHADRPSHGGHRSEDSAA